MGQPGSCSHWKASYRGWDCNKQCLQQWQDMLWWCITSAKLSRWPCSYLHGRGHCGKVILLFLVPLEWQCNLQTCHAPSWLDPEELSHTHIHLTMDCDSTQLMHCHAWAMRNILQPAISNINRYLQAGRDGMLTACTLYSFTSSIIHLDSCNQFHVHMYISHWGPGEQSPSLEIIFNS